MPTPGGTGMEKLNGLHMEELLLIKGKRDQRQENVSKAGKCRREYTEND